MAQPELVPAVPSPGLWLEMELVWSRKLCAFYLGPHAVAPLMAGDLDTLRAAEVLVEWAVHEDVRPEPVNLSDLSVPEASRSAQGEAVRFSGHDHDDQHLRSRQVWCAPPGEVGGDGPVGAAGAIGRGRFIPRQRTEAA
ncbi:hypothetical protein ACFWY5_23620 [Nonomuraea sp. NPDC059007]|uniref:hypothetical protein n=1 Tax=Nonomuraea sp. NPDC059007 TaxID=3346692 RepID=UPI0036A59C02